MHSFGPPPRTGISSDPVFRTEALKFLHKNAAADKTDTRECVPVEREGGASKAQFWTDQSSLMDPFNPSLGNALDDGL